MKSKHFSKERKDFYQNLKKSLQNNYAWVVGSTNRTIDIIVLDVRRDVQLFKIVPLNEKKNVSIWVQKLKKIYALGWYKANYTVVYVNDEFVEQKRETFSLN